MLVAKHVGWTPMNDHENRRKLGTSRLDTCLNGASNVRLFILRRWSGVIRTESEWH